MMPDIGASLFAAQTRDHERLLPDDAFFRRHDFHAGDFVAIDFQQPESGGVILATIFAASCSPPGIVTITFCAPSNR